LTQDRHYEMLNSVAKKEKENGHLNFERVLISGLKKSRKGKHHQLMGRVMEDLTKSAPGYAVKIPLSSINGLSILNLRSAIVRAANNAGFSVSTSSDDQNFYVWKTQS
jgi:hypothetical protein